MLDKGIWYKDRLKGRRGNEHGYKTQEHISSAL